MDQFKGGVNHSIIIIFLISVYKFFQTTDTMESNLKLEYYKSNPLLWYAQNAGLKI